MICCVREVDLKFEPPGRSGLKGNLRGRKGKRMAAKPGNSRDRRWAAAVRVMRRALVLCSEMGDTMRFVAFTGEDDRVRTRENDFDI